MRAVTNPRLDSMLQLIQAAASLFLGLFFNWLFILPSNSVMQMEARKKGWKKEMINTYENQDIEFKQEYLNFQYKLHSKLLGWSSGLLF